MKILAIDPGTSQSGWCRFADGKILDSGVVDNVTLISEMDHHDHNQILAIEMIASYGMPVGSETFRTVWWTGRFADRWLVKTGRLGFEVYRKQIKLHLCGSHKAKDANIRQALIDRLGAPGTKNEPGGTYGVKSHAWSALAVAVTLHDQLTGSIAKAA